MHVCDTANNRILKLNVDGKEIDSIYPKGKLQNGKKSDNYSHFNSIYPYKNRIFIIAHNYSQYSGRNSQIIILNRSSNELEKIIELDANCAHNYLIKNNSIFICDSQSGSLLIDTKSKIKLNYFLRGVAADDNSMIVGGSMYGKRAERIGKDCFIFIYDNNINIIDEIKLNNIGPVFDIRFLNNDLGDGNE